MRSRRHRTLRDQEERHNAFGAAWLGTMLGAIFEKRSAGSKTAEKPLFNIGRILVRQSRQPLLGTANGKSCRRAEKAAATAVPQFAGRACKILKYRDIFKSRGWPGPC
jgi:hypothetical protein